MQKICIGEGATSCKLNPHLSWILKPSWGQPELWLKGVINASLWEGRVLAILKCNCLAPIKETLNAVSPATYCPISNFPIWRKVIELGITQQIHVHLDAVKIPGPLPPGFHPRQSTETELVASVNEAKQ